VLRIWATRLRRCRELKRSAQSTPPLGGDIARPTVRPNHCDRRVRS
jgi:hypothetical protein